MSILAITMSCERSSGAREARLPRPSAFALDAYRDWERSLGVPHLDRASFVVYAYPGMSLRNSEIDRTDPRVIVAAWPNGEIVWSADRLEGRAPYSRATIPAESVEHVRALVSKEVGTFEDQSHVVVDGSSISIRVPAADGFAELATSHTVFEKDPRLMGSNGGIVSIAIGENTREEVMEGWTDDYRAFRAAWDRAMSACESIIPRAEAK